MPEMSLTCSMMLLQAFTSRTFQLSAQQPVDEVLSLIGDVLSADQGKLPCIFSCCRVNNQSGRVGLPLTPLMLADPLRLGSVEQSQGFNSMSSISKC